MGLACLLVVRLFKKRPHYVLLGLDFPSLSTQFGAVLLKLGVGLFAHANGRPVIAFHLRFIHFITDKYFGFVLLVEMNHDVSNERHL